MANDFDWARLKDKHIKVRKAEDFPENLSVRIHRALSWLKQAEVAEDDDSSVIFLWIAFNAAYADEITRKKLEEKSVFDNYFRKITALDKNSVIYDAIWNKFSEAVKGLMNNHYIFEDFWKYHRGIEKHENWKDEFEKSKEKLRRALSKEKPHSILRLLFDRLYTLRNQLVHGAATWQSRMNRKQVQDGKKILGELVPVFIEIMMDNPQEDWGKLHYPVINNN